MQHFALQILPAFLALNIFLTTCHDASNPFPKDTPLIALNIEIEDGVSGNLQSGTTYHHAGTKIRYNFESNTTNGYGTPHILFTENQNTQTGQITQTTEYLPPKGDLVIRSGSSLIVGADFVGTDSFSNKRAVTLIADSISDAIKKALASNDPQKIISLLLQLSADSVGRHRMREAINQIRFDSSKSSLMSNLEALIAGKYLHISRFHPDSQSSESALNSQIQSTPKKSALGKKKPHNSGTLKSNEVKPKQVVPPPIAPGQIQPQQSVPDQITPISHSTEPATIVHINGILTDPLSSLGNATEISSLMGRKIWKHTFPYRVLLLYNPSSKYNHTSGDSIYKNAKSTFECFSKITSLKGLSTVTIPLHLAKCLGKSVKQLFAKYDDIREAAMQYLQLHLGIHAPRNFSLDLTDSIDLWRNRGEHVMIIPHSQGNMMTQEAITELIQRRKIVPWDDSTCFMVVSTAAPMSNGWQLTEERFSGIANKGDIILSLNQNHFPQIETSYYRESLRKIERLKKSNEIVYYIKRLLLGIEMHSFPDGYMAHSEVTDKISGSIANQYERCALGVIEVSPGYAYIPIGTSISGNVALKNLQGGKLLGSRSLLWTPAHTNPDQPAVQLVFAEDDRLKRTPLMRVINKGISTFNVSSGRLGSTIKIEAYLPDDLYYSKIWPPI